MFLIVRVTWNQTVPSLRCGQVLSYVYLEGIVLSQSLIKNPLFRSLLSFQGHNLEFSKYFNTSPFSFLSWDFVSFTGQIK